MLKRFRDLKIATKLSLIVGTMAIPIVAAIGMSWVTLSATIATAENEQQGLAYLKPLDTLLGHVAQHRDLTVAVLAGAKEDARQVDAVTPLVDRDFAALKALIAAGNDAYQLSPTLAGLEQRWQAVKRQGLDVTLEASTAAHSELTSGVLDMVGTITDRSALRLNPDLAGTYLIDIVTARVPEAIDSLSRLRARNLEMHLRPLTLDERATALGEARQLRKTFANIRRDLALAGSHDPALKALERAEQNAVTAAEAYVAQFETNSAEAIRNAAVSAAAAARAADMAGGLAAPAAPTVSAQTLEQVFQEGESAIQAFVRLHEATAVHLEGLIDRREALLRQEQYTTLGAGLVGLLLAGALAFWVVRSITTPVRRMMAIFSAIGRGDFKARATVDSGEELGTLVLSLNAMLDNITGLLQSRDERDQMQQSIQKLLEEVSGVAEGDLTAEAEVTADMTGAMADSFNQMIGELRKIIGQVQGATIRVSMSAQILEQQTTQLAEGSDHQAAQIIDASAAVEEMAASISQVSQNAASSAAVAEQSKANAEQGAQAVTRTIEGMGAIREQVQETAKRIKRLGESSQEVGEIVQLIGDIADRTSILALNASIQAAMAGEAGRGFAVVAEEVERLADRATEATKRISMLIKTTQSETAEAVAAMEDTTREVVKGSALANEAGVALTEIKTVSERLAGLISAISDASQQQSRGSEQVARAMSEISDHTRKTAEATKETAVSIGSLAVLSGELNSSVSRFKLPSTGRGHERAA